MLRVQINLILNSGRLLNLPVFLKDRISQTLFQILGDSDNWHLIAKCRQLANEKIATL